KEDVQVRESTEFREDEEDREMDIVLESVISGHEVRIVIECRDHKRRQAVGWIEELSGKYRDQPVAKVVAVSRSGFTKTALTKARRLNIETLTLEEALDEDWSAKFKNLTARFLVERSAGLSGRLIFEHDREPIMLRSEMNLATIEKGDGTP